MNTQIANLNARESSLVGKYKAGEIVLVLCDATAAAFTVTMPEAKNEVGTVFFVKKTDSSANAVTIACRNSQTIDGSDTVVLTGQYYTATLISDKANYALLDRRMITSLAAIDGSPDPAVDVDGDGNTTLDGDLLLTTGHVLKVNDIQVVGAQQAHEEDAVTDASEAHEITDPGDSPADADALRDDLVTNAIPDTESALDALGAKINSVAATLNSLIAKIQAHGLLAAGSYWQRAEVRALVTLGYCNPSANTFAVGITTSGMQDTA